MAGFASSTGAVDGASDSVTVAPVDMPEPTFVIALSWSVVMLTAMAPTLTMALAPIKAMDWIFLLFTSFPHSSHAGVATSVVAPELVNRLVNDFGFPIEVRTRESYSVLSQALPPLSSRETVDVICDTRYSMKVSVKDRTPGYTATVKWPLAWCDG